MEYLRDLLTRLPEARHTEIPQLVPDAWLKAHADETGTIPTHLTYTPPDRYPNLRLKRDQGDNRDQHSSRTSRRAGPNAHTATQNSKA